MWKRIVIGVSIVLFCGIGFRVSAQEPYRIAPSTTSHRTSISSDDVWPVSRTGSGTPFDSSNWTHLRVFFDLSVGTANIRPLIWNSTAGKYFEDSGNTQTGVGACTFIIETNRNSSVFFIVDGLDSGATANVYIEGAMKK